MHARRVNLSNRFQIVRTITKVFVTRESVRICFRRCSHVRKFPFMMNAMTTSSTTDVSLFSIVRREHPSPNRSDMHVLLSDLPRRGLFSRKLLARGRYVLTTVFLEACNITHSTKLKGRVAIGLLALVQYRYVSITRPKRKEKNSDGI